MMVRSYNIIHNNVNLSENFKIGEFACHDGSSTILIDDELIDKLQNMRNVINNPIIISSGYRTYTYNKKVGGVNNSYHIQGRAADIIISNKNTEEIARFAQNVGFRGIIKYPQNNFVHVDTRDVVYYGESANGNTITLAGFGGNVCYDSLLIKKGSIGGAVLKLQQLINDKYNSKLKEDGIFGKNTETAVKIFQADHNLIKDGIVGGKTWRALKYGN